MNPVEPTRGCAPHLKDCATRRNDVKPTSSMMRSRVGLIGQVMALGTAMAFHAPAGVGRFDLSAAKLAGPLQRMSAPPLRLKTSAMGRRREVNGLTSLRGMAGNVETAAIFFSTCNLKRLL